MTIELDGDSLTLDGFARIVHDRAQVTISHAARSRMLRTRAHVEKAVLSGERVYSLNTGFGFLSKVTVPSDQLDQLQVNLIRSHCVGVSEPHSEIESRAMLLLRANVLAKGFSGVRPLLVELLVDMLNKGVHPVIPRKGSVGASGDLAPLAHLASVLLGEGEAFHSGSRLGGGEALRRAGLEPVKLAPKEGLSLINGTQQMTALGALLCLRAEKLVDIADLVASTSLEGVLGTPRAYVDWIQQTRPHPGQQRSAQLLRQFMEGSQIYQSHASCDRVQDPYSFRCAPQVHGACRDLIASTRRTIEIEINAATDNPLVHPDTGEIVSGGNFHGQPVAFALDVLGMAISELASISERRLSKLIDPGFSGLPAFLVKNEGLNSGFMMTQVTAAHLVCESRLLTHPASTDSIPTSNEKEDHVSMGPIAAFKACTILDNTEHVLAIEALAACQAIDFRKPLVPGRGPRLLHRLMRERVATLEEDRYLHLDIAAAVALVRSGEIHAGLAAEGLG